MAVDSNLKFICAIIATVLVIVGYCPYFRDIIRGKTTPHLYTWLIWVITQVTATFGSWYGGGKFGALSLAIGTILVIAIFCLALKYGTKNITKSDTVLLIVALLAIVVWWQMGNRLIAVLMATAIDVIAYIPTIRKSIIKPRSETLSFWAITGRSGHRLLALEFAGGLRPRNGNRLWDRLHGYLLRFGQRAADTFCRLKQSRRHHQHLQKHEHQVTRMLHH
ncbi:MAG: hypothetical protein WBN22_06100 [Verrucomicrobiia bacterium]